MIKSFRDTLLDGEDREVNRAEREYERKAAAFARLPREERQARAAEIDALFEDYVKQLGDRGRRVALALKALDRDDPEKHSRN